MKALNEALYQLMEKDERVVLIGQGVTSPWYVGGTCDGLRDRFGTSRVIDTPVSENAVTGVATGMALAGMRPILVHPRMDFMYLAMDQIANHAANWHYMFGGQLSVPITIWAIINRGGEQAAQHAQALQAVFMHIPGLKVVMPSSPCSAKGLLVASVLDNNPVVYIDDRWLYDIEEEVKDELYCVPIGKALVIKKGRHATIVSASYMTVIAEKAARRLAGDGIDVEVIDLLSLKPLDEETIVSSARKTGRVLVMDGGWRTCGVAAEISAILSEKAFNYLKAPVSRLSLPDAPAPASRVLEATYYPDEKTVVAAVKKLVKRDVTNGL